MSDSELNLGEGAILDERYELAEEIARGGFGRVYCARQMNMDREVAIKVLPPKFMDLPDVVQRFEREARLASRLSHPNTITVHDYGQHGDFLFLVMELLEGEDLADILARERSVSLERIARIARQVLKSLNEAHQHNIVHRDLKPENIFLTEISGEQDFVKVVDFGIAKLAMSEMTSDAEQDSHRSLTVEGNTVGTPTYMSPEQAAGGDIDARSDLYALGVILFEMADGRPPFDHDDAAKLMRQHIFEEVPAFEDDQLEGSWLEPIVDRALAKEKEDRFQDADEFREAIDHAIEAADDDRAFAETREQAEVDVTDTNSLQTDSNELFPAEDERSSTMRGAQEPQHHTPSNETRLNDDERPEIREPSAQSNTSSSIVTVLEPSPEEDVIVLDDPKEPPPSETEDPQRDIEIDDSQAADDPGGRTPVQAVEPTDQTRTEHDGGRATADASNDQLAAESTGETEAGASEAGQSEAEESMEMADETAVTGEASGGSAGESWSWDDSTHLPDDEFDDAMYTTAIDRGTSWGWVLLWVLVVCGALAVGYLYATGRLT